MKINKIKINSYGKLKEKEILEKGDVVVLLGGAQTFTQGLDKKVLGGIVRI